MKKFLLGLLVACMIIIVSPDTPAQGQLQAPVKDGFGEVTIVLDGKPVYDVATTRETIKQRKENVEIVLNSVVKRAASENLNVDVQPAIINGVTDISVILTDPERPKEDRVVQETRLFSVTQADVELYGAKDANEVARTISKELKEALNESIEARSSLARRRQTRSLAIRVIASLILEFVILRLINKLQKRKDNTNLLEAALWCLVVANPVGVAMWSLNIFPDSRNWLFGIQSVAVSLGYILASVAAAMILIHQAGIYLKKIQSSMGENIKPSSQKAFSTTFDGVRWLVYTTIAIVCLTIGLQAAGVKAAPFLASAGVAGVGISFASQDLIRDYINGITIFVTRTIDTGDIIEVAGEVGLVVFISPRQIQLRDGQGRLIIVPNRSIEVIRNLTKNWARATLSLVFPASAGLAKCKEILEEMKIKILSDEFCHDKLYFTQAPTSPFDVMRLDDFNSDGNPVFTVWISVLPLMQWDVAGRVREIYWETLVSHGYTVPKRSVIAEINITEQGYPQAPMIP